MYYEPYPTLNSASKPNRKKESDGEFSGGGGVKSFWNVLPLFMVAIRVYRWIQKRIENSNAYMAVVFVFTI